MSCNDLHEGLIECGDIVCPFCDLQLICIKQNPLRYDCCESPDIINDGSIVCKKCGTVQRYETASEYVDFHQNKHQLKRKSVYHREYHINNILMDLSAEYNIDITVDQKNRIMKVFQEIEKILPNVNNRRKRIISLNYIMRKIFEMMEIPYDKIPISKWKKH